MAVNRSLLLVVVLAVAVTTLALPAAAQHALNDAPADSETPGMHDGDDVGICHVGVDSPCNGEDWDDDGGLPIDIPGVPW